MRSHRKFAMSFIALLLSTLGCARPPPAPRGPVASEPGPATLSGTWRFVCCGGDRSGSLELRQQGESVSGTMRDEGSEPRPLQGSIEGTRVLLHLRQAEAPLTYELTFDARCRVMTGIMRGNVVQQTYPEVKAVSETPPRDAARCPQRTLPPPRRCFYTREPAPPPCTGIPYDVRELPERSIQVCNGCLTDAHCTEQPNGRCIQTLKDPCAGDGARACAYPGEPCHPSSGRPCPFCYNRHGRAMCGEPPHLPPSMPPSSPGR